MVGRGSGGPPRNLRPTAALTPRWIPAVIGSVGGVLLALPPVFASLQPAGPHPAAPEAYATVAPAAPRVPVAPPASPASPGGAHASTPVL
ncbi:hypothetical protein ABTX82_23755 [Streptomyces lavendulae]|uniref:hypothetical protein n=1 Tax=Streptomyces lavendulae TaxID=1914 RepID=UPI00332B214B